MKYNSWILPVLLLPLASVGCDEQLPPQEDPSAIFEMNISTAYVYNRNQNGIYFKMDIINHYEEVLSAPAVVAGEMNIEWIIPTDEIEAIATSRKIILDRTFISSESEYDRSTGILTLRPGDKLTIGFVWNFKFDDSTDVRNIKAFTQGAKKLNCSEFVGPQEIARHVFRSHAFKVTGKVKLFERGNILYFPETLVNSCSINFYPNYFCPGIQTPSVNGTPCDLF